MSCTSRNKQQSLCFRVPVTSRSLHLTGYCSPRSGDKWISPYKRNIDLTTTTKICLFCICFHFILSFCGLLFFCKMTCPLMSLLNTYHHVGCSMLFLGRDCKLSSFHPHCMHGFSVKLVASGDVVSVSLKAGQVFHEDFNPLNFWQDAFGFVSMHLHPSWLVCSTVEPEIDSQALFLGCNGRNPKVVLNICVVKMKVWSKQHRMCLSQVGPLKGN